MAALIAAARDPDFPVAFALVLSNQPGAAGLRSAQAAGVPTVVVDHRPHGGDRASHEAAIDAVLRDAEVDLVCLAGYMRRLEPSFVERWASRMLNIHPSLLPAFPGLDTHARALAAGAKLHGCTVHIVTPTVDSGPILAQAAVPVLPDDTEDALGARVLAQEHVLYPLAVRLFASGEDRVRAHRPSPEAAFLNPCPVLRADGEPATGAKHG